MEDANGQPIELHDAADQIRSVLQEPIKENSTFDRLLKLPRELFDEMVNHLTMDEQSKLASSSQAMYDYVLPVMDGFVWLEPPLPLPKMIGPDGRLPFHYVKQAEEAAKATGHVACPWCSIIHSPLRCLDTAAKGFPCASLVHRGFDDYSFPILYGLDNRPEKWHPLIVYAFAVWSQRRRHTAPLLEAAGLDHFEERIGVVGEGEGEVIPMGRTQWKMNWVPGQGLFARWRQSELITSEEDWPDRDRECCAGTCTYRTFHLGKLNQGVFDMGASFIRHVWDDADGNRHGNKTQMLTSPYRELMISRVHGCHNCSMDFEFAWQECDTAASGMCHWVHFTTWYHVGKDIDIEAIHDNMKKYQGSWHKQTGCPADCPPLGIGQVAKLSGFPVDY
ncbi:hypothetical protein PG994_008222 [Apiospora phragmitis]|uniref:F-box domain-containing protein n=1 Tax=Apiospora phragmitis TaxID=2905665 RepID=A0ABR1USE5_9PEZI